MVLLQTRILLNLLARDQEHTRLTHKSINYAETVVLSWPDLIPVSLEIDLIVGWMLSNSFAPPLRIRLDSKTKVIISIITLAQPSNRRPMHTKSQYFPPIVQYSDLEDQSRKLAISNQNLATDGASSELTLTHTESL